MGNAAAYSTILRKAGSTTAMTNQAMTGTGVGPYQLSDAAKRVLDRSVVPTFTDNGEAVPANQIASIDYLFGKVTFTEAKSGPIVMATGSYLPLATIAGGRSYTLRMGGEVLDDTTFDSAASDSGHRSRLVGVLDVQLTIAKLIVFAVDAYDDFIATLQARTPIMIEVDPASSAANKFRGWYVTESDEVSGDVAALEEEGLSFQLDGDAKSSFGWGA